MNLSEPSMEDIIKKINKASETLLLDQLNDFVSRGLIIIEQGPMSLVQDQYSQRISIQQTVKLTLKDKEYIEKLEQENKELRDDLKLLSDHFKKIGS